MGCYSVTGVSGVGAAVLQKGPGNGRDQYVPLSTPHVVETGSVTTANGVVTVTLATPLPMAAANYQVYLQAAHANAVAAYVSAMTDSSGKMVSFAVTCGAAGATQWMIVKTGQGVDTVVANS